MSTTINSRIIQIISASGVSTTAYAKKIGIAQTSLRGVCIENAEPRFSTLEKIIIAEPLVSLEWLLTGEGEMLKDLNDKTAQEVKKDDIESNSYLVKELLDALKRRDKELEDRKDEMKILHDEIKTILATNKKNADSLAELSQQMKKDHAPLEGNAADADVS